MLRYFRILLDFAEIFESKVIIFEYKTKAYVNNRLVKNLILQLQNIAIFPLLLLLTDYPLKATRSYEKNEL